MSLKRRTITAILWDVTGSLANKGSGFVMSIFLARILTPEEFGLVGMVMVFVTFSTVLLDIGLGSALIQRQQVHSQDYSSVLILNSLMGVILSFGLFWASDAIGRFYQNPIIPDLCRALCLIFFINSLGVIPKTKLTKELEFGKLAKVSLLASIMSGLVGILMAMQGFGVWSLIAQILLAGIFNVLFLWTSVNWFPGWVFSWSRIKSLWGFGFNIFLSSFLNNVISKLDILLIGKLFSPAQLGYYARAQSVTNLIDTYGGRSTMRVLFPALSKIQENKLKLKAIYEKGLKVISFLSFNMIGLLYLTADSWFILLFGNKWVASIPLLKIMLIRSFIPSLSALSINILKATGKGRQILVSEVLKKFLFLLAVVIGFNYGIIEFLYALLLQGILGLGINFVLSGTVLNVSTFHQIRIVLPYALYTTLLVLGIDYLLTQMNLSLITELIFSTVTFILILTGGLKFTKNEIYPMIQNGFKLYFIRT